MQIQAAEGRHTPVRKREESVALLTARHKQPVSPPQSQTPHVSKCYVVQLTASASGVSAFKSDCHWCIALTTSHGCSFIWSACLPSCGCYTNLRKRLARQLFVPSFMSILSSPRGQWGRREVEETAGFYFAISTEVQRRKGSKQVNHCSRYKNKDLVSYLWGSGMWILKEWGKILKPQAQKQYGKKQNALTWKPWWHLLVSHSVLVFFLKLLPTYLMMSWS